VKVWTRIPTHQPREKDKWPRFDPLALTLGGLAVFLAGHLPFIASASYPFQHRHSYVPMLGLLMAFGAAAEWFGRQVAEKKWAARYRAATGIALLAVLAPLTIMMLGQQHLMRTRWLMDLDIGRQLRELVPNPASGSLFVPVRSDDRAMRRGPDWFRRSVVGIFQTNWSAGNAYQMVYRRADVFGTNAGDFGERPVSVGVDEVRIAPPPYMQAPAFAPDWRWPRQRVVEFSINEQGLVSVPPKPAPSLEAPPAR
jgi:hypothetical protein